MNSENSRKITSEMTRLEMVGYGKNGRISKHSIPQWESKKKPERVRLGGSYAVRLKGITLGASPVIISVKRLSHASNALRFSSMYCQRL